MKVTPSQKSPRVLSLFYGRNSSSGNGDLIEWQTNKVEGDVV